jgi:glucosyl-3-phosphoglycerate synthase
MILVRDTTTIYCGTHSKPGSAKYINQVIVTLGRTNEKEFEHAKEFFSVLPQQATLIWNDGERVKSLYTILNKNDISAG